MKITKEEVAHVAHLARLALPGGETERFTAQLNDILLYMDNLNEVDTGGVSPMTHAIAQKNAFRDDNVGSSLSPADSLSNAPEVRGGCFQVPKVID